VHRKTLLGTKLSAQTAHSLISTHAATGGPHHKNRKNKNHASNQTGSMGLFGHLYEVLGNSAT
jgi:hypothetical protein